MSHVKFDGAQVLYVWTKC